MAITSKAILKLLENVIGADGRPRRLKEAIENELLTTLRLSPIQAAEKAEVLESPVREL